MQHFKYKIRHREGLERDVCTRGALLVSCEISPCTVFHWRCGYFCTSAGKQWCMGFFFPSVQITWGIFILLWWPSSLEDGLTILSKMSPGIGQWWLLWTQVHHMHSPMASLYIYFFYCTRSRDGRYLGHNSQSVPALLNFSSCVFRQIFGFAGAGWHIVLAHSDLLSQCHPFNTER